MINTQNIAELSEKVAALEAAIKTAGIELPTVTTDDNGKTLQVVAGKWDTGSKIPTSADDIPYSEGVSVGDMLDISNGTITIHEGAGITSARKSLFKVGNVKYLSGVFTPSETISSDTILYDLSESGPAGTVVDIIASTSDGNVPLYISGNYLKANGSLTSGKNYFFNGYFK